MAISIELNNLKYRYDVYQIFNLFFPLNQLDFNTPSYDYKIEIGEDSILIEDKNGSESFNINKDISIKEEVKKSSYTFLEKRTGKKIPWGTLVGIRPSKIALSLLKEGKCEEEIIDYYKERHIAAEEKAKLCIEVAKIESNMVNNDKRKISIYIGMPFCPTRCLYCSFTSNPIVSCKNVVGSYLNALTKEIEEISKFIKEKELIIETLYFGGGTPTSIKDEEFEDIMEKIYNNFIYDNNVHEFTVECGRPDSLSMHKFSTMKKYGVTRISINPQTMNDDTLKLIGRNHSVEDIKDKYRMARDMGFNNINMDIIVGLPGERLSHIKNTCKEIYNMRPDSITVHGMSFKKGSKLYEKLEEYLRDIEQDELNRMYEETFKLSKDLNMSPYYMYRQKNMVGNMENVGYSLKDKECIYNIQMIEERQTIIALGADAVTKVVYLELNKIERVPNVKDVLEYNNRIDEMINKKITELNKLY
ncbi:MAG: coproporphyrinogen III oxidase [Clostridiaceae bacterium]